MADTKFPKRPILITPKGMFKYAKLTKPDFGTEKFVKPDGEYNVTLCLTKEEAAPLIAELDKAMEESLSTANELFAQLSVAARKKLGAPTSNVYSSVEYDRDTEEETGRILFKFKTKASGVSRKTGKKWKRDVPMFDAAGVALKVRPDVWGGTVGRVAYSVRPYFVDGSGVYGISLDLESVQIIKLVTGGQGANAKAFGFKAEEGEFSAESVNPTFDDATPATPESSGTDDDASAF